ncbi:MAG: hypothetical protein ACUVUH_10065, partial [bacterium]
ISWGIGSALLPKIKAKPWSATITNKALLAKINTDKFLPTYGESNRPARSPAKIPGSAAYDTEY